MGNGGFGVLNDTDMSLQIGLSMDAVHYFENEVAPREIFYRRPGAVWYTVFAYQALPNNEITKTKVTWGIIKVTGKIILPVIVVVGGLISLMVKAGTPISNVVSNGSEAVVGGANLLADGLKNIQNVNSIEIPNMYCCRQGCYGGGAGTWIVVENAGDKITMRTVSREYVIRLGHFTNYSQCCWEG